MTEVLLDRTVFNDLLDLHGADLSRWPVDKVKPALALMAQNAAAQTDFERIRRLDDALRLADNQQYNDLAHRHGASADALRERILRVISDQTDAALLPQPVMMAASASRSLRDLFAPGGVLLIVGLIGFMMGFQQPASADDGLADGVINGQDIVMTNDSALTMGVF